MMSGIRGSDTRPERVVRKFFHAAGLRYRLHDRTLPGCPDLVLPKYRSVVFVHGCFWHRHPECRFAYVPKSNTAFWESKLGGNVRRDAQQIEILRTLGWNVFVIWECTVESPALLQRVVEEIRTVPDPI
jgi:DNA mismatch endonuclease, patch repair protein